jgi:hypothetical protein
VRLDPCNHVIKANRHCALLLLVCIIPRPTKSACLSFAINYLSCVLFGFSLSLSLSLGLSSVLFELHSFRVSSLSLSLSCHPLRPIVRAWFVRCASLARKSEELAALAERLLLVFWGTCYFPNTGYETPIPCHAMPCFYFIGSSIANRVRQNGWCPGGSRTAHNNTQHLA